MSRLACRVITRIPCHHLFTSFPVEGHILFVFSLQIAFHDLYSVFRFVNPLIPGAFCPKRFFWTFFRFSGWILAKLALI